MPILDMLNFHVLNVGNPIHSAHQGGVLVGVHLPGLIGWVRQTPKSIFRIHKGAYHPQLGQAEVKVFSFTGRFPATVESAVGHSRFQVDATELFPFRMRHERHFLLGSVVFMMSGPECAVPFLLAC